MENILHYLHFLDSEVEEQRRTGWLLSISDLTKPLLSSTQILGDKWKWFPEASSMVRIILTDLFSVWRRKKSLISLLLIFFQWKVDLLLTAICSVLHFASKFGSFVLKENDFSGYNFQYVQWSDSLFFDLLFQRLNWRITEGKALMPQKNEIPCPWGEGGESFCQSGKVLLGCLVGFGREMFVLGFFWREGKYFLLLLPKVRPGPSSHSVLCLRMSVWTFICEPGKYPLPLICYTLWKINDNPSGNTQSVLSVIMSVQTRFQPTKKYKLYEWAKNMGFL